MNFLDLYESRQEVDNMNKELEKLSTARFALRNRHYQCDDLAIATETGIVLGEPLRYLLVNLGIDPLNVEINQEEDYAVLYHESGRMFRVKTKKGTNPASISMYKDMYLDFETLEELYSDY